MNRYILKCRDGELPLETDETDLDAIKARYVGYSEYLPSRKGWSEVLDVIPAPEPETESP